MMRTIALEVCGGQSVINTMDVKNNKVRKAESRIASVMGQ